MAILIQMTKITIYPDSKLTKGLVQQRSSDVIFPNGNKFHYLHTLFFRFPLATTEISKQALGSNTGSLQNNQNLQSMPYEPAPRL